ncbi:phage tail tube protein [Mesorhizobium sp. M1B.F.Ca.ET.045.04.1.1]|uniref:phage tail tube protein n=1 Tax=Mesorhizobium sp. M1B.F.Ca.ET.045.04.1.1 TaxID=2493673 RepID=UPI000F756512|nr:phage tail tube protein [Mesorhizobium sp. M1B.F.Ca.ET.045.04.1.1]AZO29428.1 hypothetical protein EJ071_19885 [Mesorhizobium sp. M1B.F.Ca.ET.045.04.1.1]
MVASTGKVGLGTTFKVGDGGSPEVFTSVVNVTAINISGRSVEEVDFTHLASTGGFREFRPGFKDPGEIKITCHYNPTDATLNGTTGLEAKLNSGATFNWEIDMTNAGFAYKLTGFGYVSGGDFTFTGEDPINFEVTIRVSGQIDESVA